MRFSFTDTVTIFYMSSYMRVKDCLQPGIVSTASTSPQTEYKELWFASYFAHISSTFSLIYFLNNDNKIQG